LETPEYKLDPHRSDIVILLKLLGYNDNDINDLDVALNFNKETDGPTSRRTIKVNPFYKALPYGINEGKIFVPEAYKFIVNDDGEIDLETIYNICMISRNYYYWFIMDFYQKRRVYDTLKKFNKKPLIGFHDRFADFGYLFDKVISIVDQYCMDDVLVLASKERIAHANINEEIRKLIDLNMDHIVRIVNQIKGITEQFGSQLLASALEYTKIFSWFLVKDRVIMTKLDGTEFFINGLPEARNANRREYSR